jgi:hypothetical protein
VTMPEAKREPGERHDERGASGTAGVRAIHSLRWISGMTGQF